MPSISHPLPSPRPIGAPGAPEPSPGALNPSPPAQAVPLRIPSAAARAAPSRSPDPYDAARLALRSGRLDLVALWLPRLNAVQYVEVLVQGLSWLPDAAPLLALFEPLQAPPRDADRILIVAVLHKQPLAVIQRLLEAGCLTRTQRRDSCLHSLQAYPAAQQEALLALLMRFGADVDQPGVHLETPLHRAVKQAPDDAVEGAQCLAATRHLLAQGASVSAWSDDWFGSQALHLAAAGATAWHTEMVRALLDAGADVNACTRPPDPRKTVLGAYWGAADRTPLMLACRGGSLATVALLLEHGADAALKDSEGATALSHAAHNADPAVARCLLQAHSFSAAQHRRAARCALADGHYRTCWAIL